MGTAATRITTRRGAPSAMASAAAAIPAAERVESQSPVHGEHLADHERCQQRRRDEGPRHGRRPAAGSPERSARTDGKKAGKITSRPNRGGSERSLALSS